MMKGAARQARTPRSPLSARSDPNSTTTTTRDGAAAAVAAWSETRVRRRLAQTEAQLRDADEDARRIRALQDQEIESLERDNKRLRERVEEIRMEECMSLAEARALQEYTDHHRSAGAPTGSAESKLVGSATLKYQHAKAEVQKLRHECAQAERQLAEARGHLVEVRNRHKELKRRSVRAEMSAAARIAAADNYRALIHERLRSLEEQVAREQECFNRLVTEAKQVRSDVDALLMNQTSNERIYRSRHDALLAKRREMAYLMEVCNVLCEERQHVVAQLTGLQARMAEESRQYETAFDELTGVQSESAKTKAANREQLEELRRIVAQTRAEREALEEENRCAKAAIQGERRRTIRCRLNDVASAASTSQASLGCTAMVEGSGVSVAARAGVVDGDGGEGLRTPDSVLSLDGSQQQIRTFEDYYRRLSTIVQSDAIEDVTGFMDAAADERYKSFDEMNAIQRDMAALEAEKAALMAELSGGGGGARAAALFFGAGGPEAPVNVSEPLWQPFTPTSSLAALASADTLEDLASVTARVAAAKSGCPSASGTSTDGKHERGARMASLIDDLGATRDLVSEQEDEQEASAAVLAQVVALVNEVFCGLGCSTDELRALTGWEGVQQSTLLQCIAMIEQRASEYLMAYSLQQQRLQSQTSGAWPEAQTKAAVAASSVRNAARTLLRRSDLEPRAAKNAVAATLASQAMPRSTDVAAVMSTTDALATSISTSVEGLVDERPLSKAELKGIVESKRALQRR
ncbi:hypothetical protein CUR178_07547 [Leishmania enriettii]|uniref:ODAD1 central coiled coil region domain-containing protein n=1 Tax=Leishmania enriettii TaxID=5663 RepID=A0A836I0R5_LEIEN|nr:hypothetical protein CUR178_07547 [Leishmania enriettii]